MFHMARGAVDQLAFRGAVDLYLSQTGQAVTIQVEEQDSRLYHGWLVVVRPRRIGRAHGVVALHGKVAREVGSLTVWIGFEVADPAINVFRVRAYAGEYRYACQQELKDSRCMQGRPSDSDERLFRSSLNGIYKMPNSYANCIYTVPCGCTGAGASSGGDMISAHSISSKPASSSFASRED